MTNTATEKQINYLLKLGATAEQVKDLTIKAASIMIGKLLKAQKENNNNVIKKEKAEKVQEYEHGYKVGDVLYMSWGYEQTNLNFFQVVAVTEKSVRIVEVAMKQTTEKYHGSMSRDVAFDITTAQPLEKSYWIKDQQKGDIKKVKYLEYYKKFYIKVNDRHIEKYNGEELYESWYY
jgi:uncharacterized membrane-anchored protein YjiN (DUF445 family)